MNEHVYTTVPTEEKDGGGYKNEKRVLFMRQLFVSSGLWTVYFTVGLWLGTPTVYIPQVRREANSIVSLEMASWLSSVFGIAAIPAVLILSYVTTRFGRKRTINYVSIHMLIVAISFHISTNPMQVLISEILQGIPHACSLSTSIISLVEYTSPENRGLLLTIKSATTFWGIWVANAIGTFTHWKYICTVAYIPALYSLTSFFWPESPVWLASQGRFEECRKAHRWLKGRNADAEKELQELIDTQTEARKNIKSDFKSSFKFLTLKEFYRPISLASLMVLLFQLSGKQAFAMYAVDILKKITNNETAAYNWMLLLDGVSILSMYSGCILAKYLRRRTLLFSFGIIAVLFLFLLSLFLYLCSLSVLDENKYVAMFLLLGYTLAIGLGPMILATSLYAELIPSNFKGQSVIVVSLIFVVIQATILKTSPNGFMNLGLHGMCMLYGISVSICLIILYKYLPETKDKTLLEIEAYFRK